MSSEEEDYSDAPCDEVEPDSDGHTSEESCSDDSSDDEYYSDSDEQSSMDDPVDDRPTAAGRVWSAVMGEDVGPASIPFTSTPGPRQAPPPDADPIDYVNLFITTEFVHHVVTETNRYADQWICDYQTYLRQKPRSRVHQWIRQGHTTRAEIFAFIALTINMGLNRKPTLAAYFDSINPSQSSPWFVEHFNRDRLSLLLKFLHFSDSDSRPPPDHPDYKLFKIRPIVDRLNNSFLNFYNPHQHISIDESMIGYKGKTPHLRQFMPNKRHARYGIKVWCLCDAETSYTSHFEVYKGTADPQDCQAEGMTYNLVMRMMEASGLFHRGHHLGLDNYFTSPKLVEDLYRAHTTATGTVRKKRKGLPRSVTDAKLANKTVIERRKGNLLCIAYKDGSRQPILLSTHSAGGFATTTNSKGKTQHLPKPVILYNKTMGGVDMSDARLCTYLSERRTMKWTNKVFFALLARSVLNAYIIYTENTSHRVKLSRYQFTISVAESMMGNFRPPAKVRRRRRTAVEIARSLEEVKPPAADAHVEPGPSTCQLIRLALGKRRNCVHRHGRRTRSTYECSTCDVGLCAVCFVPYHQEKDLQH